MENSEPESLEDAEKELSQLSEEELNANGLSGKLVKRMINGLKSKGREGKQLVDTLVITTQASKLSELAQKQYYDVDKDKPKTNADYDKADEFLGRSIKLLDKAMSAFPTLIPSLLPIKKKVMVQQLDVKYQRNGIIKSPEELQAEVEKEFAENDAKTNEVV